MLPVVKARTVGVWLGFAHRPVEFPFPTLRSQDRILGGVALERAYRLWELAHLDAHRQPYRAIRARHLPPRIETVPSLRCSLAHDRGLAVAAVSPATVGVDLVSRSRFDRRFLERIAAPAEIALTEHCSISSGERAAFLWAMKEAALKAAGLGLARDPRRVTVSSAPSGECTVEVPAFPEGPTLHGRSDLRDHRDPSPGSPRRFRVEVFPWRTAWIAIAREEEPQ